MADVTDCVFRQIIAKYGKPDVSWTEFVSADGLAHPKVREKLLIDLKFSKKEHPIVAQIFGSNPDNIQKASALCQKLGFDGVDINMGCPVKKVLNQNSCSALIRTPELAKEIILAAKRGAGDIPVSVKTRIGFNKMEIDTWIPSLLEAEPAILTVHLRTVKEMSKVGAHWETMKEIVNIRDRMKKETLIIGNGDVLDLEDGKRKCAEYGCDGVMLGRAIFGNPWLFSKRSPLKFYTSEGSTQYSGKGAGMENFKGRSFIEKKLKVLVEHTKLFEKLLGKHKNFAIMKKHYKAYANGFEGAKELRVKLMETKNAKEVGEIINDFLKQI